MSPKPGLEHLAFVSQFLEQTRTELAALRLIPRDTPADPILLGLLSRSIVLAESIVLLVSNEFDDEAFTLCRTCVEIELTIRYMTNADTIKRCRRYQDYFARVQQDFTRLYQRYYPQANYEPRRDAEELARIASSFKDPNHWSEPNHRLKYFAEEPDSFEYHPDGSRMNQLFYYEVIYKWMSYYVHAAEPSLAHHVTLPGDLFRVHPVMGRSARGGHAVRTAYQFVYVNMVRIFRYFNMTMPPALSQLYEEALARQEKVERP